MHKNLKVLLLLLSIQTMSVLPVGARQSWRQRLRTRVVGWVRPAHQPQPDIHPAVHPVAEGAPVVEERADVAREVEPAGQPQPGVRHAVVDVPADIHPVEADGHDGEGVEVNVCQEEISQRDEKDQAYEKLFSLESSPSEIFSVAFRPDGRCIATASADYTAHIWDAKTGMHLHTLSGHEDACQNVVFSPDNRYIATASCDGTARLWNAETGTHIYTLEIETLEGHTRWVSSIVFDPQQDFRNYTIKPSLRTNSRFILEVF